MRRNVLLLLGLLLLTTLASAEPRPPMKFSFAERGEVIGNLYRLGLQNNPDNIPVFCEALKDENQAVREAAVAQLLFTHDERAVQPVIAVLKDRSRLVRRLAISVLERIGSKDSVPALTEVLTYRPPDYRE